MNTSGFIFFIFLFAQVGHAIDSDGEDLTMMNTKLSPTIYTCADLRPGQTDRMDDEEGDPLFQVPQVNDQGSVTNGVGVMDNG